jgi:cytochrome c peroxidase
MDFKTTRITFSLTLLLILILGWCGQVSAISPKDNELIRKGRDLFLNATFGGNGRTCASCHPEENNFTLDPKFIATIPDNDPLFVHEFDPKLAELEDAVLLRKFGLFLENVDGFDNPPVFRGVPHNIGLKTSIEHSDSNLTSRGIGHALGWSGDGSADGSLNGFAVGAIIQHFPKTLNRIEGEDFILPTQEEKDAIEAFMFSLGRQEEIDLANMNFKSSMVNLGKQLFFSPVSGPCNACHANAGANSINAGGKINFDIGVENLLAAPHILENPDIARDAGLGGEPHLEGGFGDGSFNTPPLVEAADTAPFFHNNAVNNIESAVAFYTSDAFRNSPAAQHLGSDVQLDTSEVQAIAAMLRTLNALENIRSTTHAAKKAQSLNIEEGREKLYPALFDSQDAYQVLDGMEYNLYDNASDLLREAYANELSAYWADQVNDRNYYLKKAIHLKKKARKMMVN